MKRVVSLIITIMMIIASISPAGVVFADDEVTEYIKNGGFETDYWSDDGVWNVNATWNTDTKVEHKTDAKVSGEKSLNFYTKTGEVIDVSQSVTLPAGKYQLSAQFMGENATGTLKIFDNDSFTETAVISTTGWNNWAKGILTFEITEEGSYKVGISIDSKDGGWGYLDDMSLTLATDNENNGNNDDNNDEETEQTGLNIEKIDGLSEDFIRAVDISSVIAEEDSGVTYKNVKGEEEDIFKILKDSGVNCVRVRIWNDPNDSKGNTYGGGHNDVATAVKIAKRCEAQGLNVWVDFHYSDFWAHPNNQVVPKAWKSYSVDQKASAIKSFTKGALTKIEATGANISIVQVGNETTQAFCGLTEAKDGWSAICKLLKAGCEAVKDFNPNIKRMIHFGGDAKGNHIKYAGYLKTYGVDYDIFGISWYPYYSHGDIDYLKQNLEAIHEKTGKPVIVAENSYPITFDDTDGHPNTFGEDKYFSNLSKLKWSISPQGQATEVRDTIEVVNSIGDGNGKDGIGYCYWEPAWIPVGNTYNKTGSDFNSVYANNQKLWSTYGSGWATEAAGSYGASNADKYWGGSSWDNQAMFDASGKALESLSVFKDVYEGTKSDKVQVKDYEEREVILTLDEETDKTTEELVWSNLKGGANCTMTDGSTKWVDISKWGDDWRWVKSDIKKVIEAYDSRGTGSYIVNGILSDDLHTIATTKFTIVSDNNIEVNNSGFETVEDGAFTGWDITGDGYDTYSSDAKSGSNALKFWKDSDFEFTVSQKLENLEKGFYSLSAFIQGGGANENASFKLWYQINNGEKQYADATLAGYKEWQNPKFDKVEISSSGSTMLIGFTVVGNSGCWGTIDDFTVKKLETYSVKYNKGTQAKGIAAFPVDSKSYLKDDALIIKKGITSTDKFFVSWNTKEDGTGTTYPAGSEIKAPMNLSLYPKWTTTYTSSSSIKYKVVGKNQVAVIGTGPKAVKTLTIPATITVNGIVYKVVSIGKSAFKNNLNLKSVVIGSNVKTISSTAFYGCKNISNVKAGTNVTSIGTDAFYGCKNISAITFGKNLTTIGTRAFYGCKKLVKITLGNKVKTIGSYAFYGCSGLKKITIGKGLKAIGKNVLYGTNKNMAVIIKSKVLKTTSSVLTTKKVKMVINVPNPMIKKYTKILKIKKMKGKIKIK